MVVEVAIERGTEAVDEADRPAAGLRRSPRTAAAQMRLDHPQEDVQHGTGRHGLLDPNEARDRLAWVNTGFSLDAAVRITGHDRTGLERLLRYGARPPFALERIEQVNRWAMLLARLFASLPLVCPN